MPTGARRSNASSAAASPLEQREKLEQLRALEAGMRIDAALVDTVPLGVDTPADLETARADPRQSLSRCTRRAMNVHDQA